MRETWNHNQISYILLKGRRKHLWKVWKPLETFFFTGGQCFFCQTAGTSTYDLRKHADGTRYPHAFKQNDQMILYQMQIEDSLWYLSRHNKQKKEHWQQPIISVAKSSTGTGEKLHCAHRALRTCHMQTHARSRLSPLDVMKWYSSRVLGTGLWNGSHHVLPRPLAQRTMHQQPPERTTVPIVIWHNPTKPAQTTLWYCGNHMMASSLNHTGTCDMQGLGSAP